jgi:hypothetical protein
MTYEEAYGFRKQIFADVDRLVTALPPDSSSVDNATIQLNAVARYVEASVQCRRANIKRNQAAEQP